MEIVKAAFSAGIQSSKGIINLSMALMRPIGRGNAKQSAAIHFLGGIHEIYFPYACVLMNQRLLIAVIIGGMTGIFTLNLLGGGLVHRRLSAPFWLC